MTLDILITTGGGWPYPKLCIDSVIAGMPDGVRILVRDNPASKQDETFEYLMETARAMGPERFLLFSPEWSGEHGHNMDFLVGKCAAEWALIIDSDLEFVSNAWFDSLAEFIREYPSMQCAVEMSAQNLKPEEMAFLPGHGDVSRRWMPRASSWFMLFRPRFVRDQGISFGRNDYEVQIRFQDVYKYPLPKFVGTAPVQRWTMENGWQLLWAGLYANGLEEFSCIQLPPHIRKLYVHHGHKICTSMFKSGHTPNSPTSRKFWGSEIPQIIP